MQFGLFAISAASLLAGSVSATCLSDQAATKVAQNFATLFSAYSPQFVDQVLTPDFKDQSDTVNWLMSNGTGCPKQVCTQLTSLTIFPSLTKLGSWANLPRTALSPSRRTSPRSQTCPS